MDHRQGRRSAWRLRTGQTRPQGCRSTVTAWSCSKRAGRQAASQGVPYAAKPRPSAFTIPGPVDCDCTPFDLLAPHETPVAAVLGVVTVVAHHEVGIARHRGRLATVRVAAIARWRTDAAGSVDVRFPEKAAVHIRLIAADQNLLTRKRDD